MARQQVGASTGVIALRPYQPSVRLIYQPAAFPNDGAVGETSSKEAPRPPAAAAAVRMPILPTVSPEKWDETISDPLPVLRIAWQIRLEKSLFVNEAPDQKRHHGRDRDKSPVRAERQWRSAQVQCPACVHRMPNDGVRSGRDDFLVLRELDGR